MKFIVVTNEWMSAHGIIPLPTMRKSRDGSKIILHEDYFRLLAQKDEEGNLVLDGATAYAHNSPELDALLATDEWSGEGGGETHGADFIQAAAVRNLMNVTKAGIQAMTLSPSEALEVKDLYPDWQPGIEVKEGERYNCDGSLWEALQSHATQEGWRPGEATLSIWKKVDAGGHAGTPDDPIPFEQGMSLEAGKYYTQYGVTYRAIQDAVAVVYDLKEIPAIAEKV